MKEVQLGGTAFTWDIAADDTLAVCAFALEGSGKTRFICTAPDPIGVVPLDRKSRRTIASVSGELGKRVLMPKEDFIRHANPIELAKMNEKEAIRYYTAHVSKVMEAAYQLRDHAEIRTVAIDPGHQLWEDILFMHYGRNQRIMPRDRGAANQTMIDFLNAMTSKHFIITHRAKQVWQSVPDGKGGTEDKPIPGKYKIAGFTDVGFYTNVVVEMKRNEFYVPENGAGGGKDWQFSMDIVTCQDNAMLQGPAGKNVLTDGDISFGMLMATIHADDPDFDLSPYM